MDETQAFRELVWQKAHELYRDMPWRDDPSFYHVLVSELMLQQTQVSRGLVKFEEFMRAFPTINDLASASLAEVLRVWQGLGYNRRAKYLHDAAKYVVTYGQPQTIDGLVTLPGIGRNTAGALMNYVYEIPTPFVETNIRTVYLHHFFMAEKSVSDAEIITLVEATMDRVHPREWYWALMDYGAWLKGQGAGALMLSAQHRKQSPLKGSVREVRGQIVRQLSEGRDTQEQLEKKLGADERFILALEGLVRDGLVEQSGVYIHLTKR